MASYASVRLLFLGKIEVLNTFYAYRSFTSGFFSSHIVADA